MKNRLTMLTFQTDKQKIYNQISLYQFSKEKNRNYFGSKSIQSSKSQEQLLFNNGHQKRPKLYYFWPDKPLYQILKNMFDIQYFKKRLPSYQIVSFKQQHRFYSNQQIQQAMTSNNISRSYSSSTDCVFIEKDQHMEIDEMKRILNSGSIKDIKNFFFTSSTSSDLNIGGVTQNQIRKHSQALSHRNKNYLRHLLRQRKENKEMTSQFKGFNEQKTNYALQQGDGEIQQYLSLNQGLQFFQSGELM